MNSVQHTVLWIVLVGAAFIFGRYLHHDFTTENSQHAATAELFGPTENSSIARLDHAGQNRLQGNDQASSMPTLKPNHSRRADRQANPLPEGNLAPDLNNSKGVPSMGFPGKRQAQRDYDGEVRIAGPEHATRSRTVTEPVVEPDFSRYSPKKEHTPIDSGFKPIPPSNTSPETSVAAPVAPAFDSHFPNQSSRDATEPVIDYSQSSVTRIDHGSTNTQPMVEVQRRDQTKNHSSDFVDPPRPPHHSTPSVIARQVTLQANVVPVRPRDSAPVMLNATRFHRHVVAEGETLQSLATKYFGDPNYYLDIYSANYRTLNHPGPLTPGTELKIPQYE